MLTDYQYEALLRYRDAVIPVPPEGLPPVDMELLEMRLIEPAEFGSSDYGIVKIHATPLSYQITEKGKQALEEYEKPRKPNGNRKGVSFSGTCLSQSPVASSVLLSGRFLPY